MEWFYKASSFSPIPKNLIGLPVIARTESAAPPRASPSVLVRITPVSAKASLNALAVFQHPDLSWHQPQTRFQSA